MTTRIAADKLYANDEDLLIACPGDFAQLCPVSQVLAEARDGSFPANDDGSWVLTSAFVDFAARGVAAGHVCQLLEPVTTWQTPDLLVVSSAAANVLTLRRAGLAAGLGQPPGPVVGIPSGVRFRIATLYPQIEAATYELNQLFALDPASTGRTFADLYDPREAQRACIAFVLWTQYLAMSRMSDREDEFAYKAKQHRAEYERIIARATIHFSSLTSGQSAQMAWPRLTR